MACEDLKKKIVLVVLFLFLWRGGGGIVVPTPDGWFLFGTDTNVFPDPADGADDGVWIVHIFVVGGHWADG